MRNEVVIYTDGSSKGNPGPGGWAAVIKTKSSKLKSKNKEVFGEAFNIGAGRNISVNKVTCEIIKLSGKRIKAKYGPAVIEPKHTLADYSKAKKFLGWAPKTGFEGGLKRAYEDMTKRK